MNVQPASAPNASTAVPAMVLGILGIILCPLLGPFAWVLGRKGEQEIDASGGAIGGRGLATTGKILGMVGTFFIVLGIVIGVALALLAPDGLWYG